jgi:hypothetical protein
MTQRLQTDRLHQENAIFSNRLNLLLIGESMLLVSYVGAWNIVDSSKSGILWSLCILGFLITLVFSIIIKEHSKYISKLAEKIQKNFPDVAILGENPASRITNFLAVMLPASFMFIWIYFLIITIVTVF